MKLYLRGGCNQQKKKRRRKELSHCDSFVSAGPGLLPHAATATPYAAQLLYGLFGCFDVGLLFSVVLMRIFFFFLFL